MSDPKKHIHVNIPFRMLLPGYLPKFIEGRVNPEIGFDAEALDGYSYREFRSVSEQLHEHGLEITFHFPFMDLSPGSPDPEVRRLTIRRFEQMLPLISLFRPKTAVCHTGYDSRRYGFMQDLWLRNSLTIWPDLARKTAEEGCVLMLENVYEDGPSDIMSLVEPLQECGVGFCLDAGHQAVFGKTPLHEWIVSMAPYLRQVHLHDNLGKKDDHMAPGRGSIDFDLLFREMRQRLSVPPLMTLEPHTEEDVVPSLQFVERAWPW
jgi:sugar phosphate isomerase/epimerase